MQTFHIVGHIKKYAKVQRVIEDWENAGELYIGGELSLNTLKESLSYNPESSRAITSSATNPLIIKKIREVREIYPNMGKDKIFHLQEFRDYCNFLHCKIPSISTIGRIIARDPFKMRYSLKRVKIKRIRVYEKRRKPKDYTSPPLQTIAMNIITYRFEGRNRYVLTADRKSTRLNSSHKTESRMPSSA